MGKITMELMLEAIAQVEAGKSTSKCGYAYGLTRSEACDVFRRTINNKDEEEYTIYVTVVKEEE